MSPRSSAAALALVALAAAASAFAPATALAAERDAPQRLDVLRFERVSSPVVGALRERLDGRLAERLAGPREPLAAARLDAVLLDGDSTTPVELQRRLGGLRRLLARGAAVLAVDVKAAHFRRGLHALSGFRAAVRGERRTSRAVLLRRAGAGGDRRSEVIDVPRLLPDGAVALRGAERQRAARAHVRGAATELAGKLRPRRGGAARVAADAAAAPLPPELQRASFSETKLGSRLLPGPYFDPGNPDYADRWRSVAQGRVEAPRPSPQTAQWRMTHSFEVYIANGEDPAGDNAVVNYSFEGDFNPTMGPRLDPSAGGPFAYMGAVWKYLDNPVEPLILERAWWTAQAGVSIRPDAANTYLLHSSEPAPGERTGSYAAGGRFEVPYQASRGKGSASLVAEVDDSASGLLPSWGVEATTSPASGEASWTFSSRTPCDIRDGHYSAYPECFSGPPCAAGGCSPREPGQLSRGELSYRASAAWLAPLPARGKPALQRFAIRTPIVLADLYCYRVDIFHNCRSDSLGHTLYSFGGRAGEWLDFSFDAAAVLPPPALDLRLDTARADGARRQDVQGTVMLSEAVTNPAGVTVVVNSDSANARLGDGGRRLLVPIQQGQRSARFAIATNGAGIAPGGSRTATITAFHLKPQRAEMVISG